MVVPEETGLSPKSGATISATFNPPTAVSARVATVRTFAIKADSEEEAGEDERVEREGFWDILSLSIFSYLKAVEAARAETPRVEYRMPLEVERGVVVRAMVGAIISSSGLVPKTAGEGGMAEATERAMEGGMISSSLLLFETGVGKAAADAAATGARAAESAALGDSEIAAVDPTVVSQEGC